MKRWIATVMIGALATLAQAAVVDEWDMNGNAQWQSSNNGINLGSHYNTNNQAVAQVAEDGTFNFSPSPAFDPDGSAFGGTGPLSSTNSLIDNVIRLSWSYTAMDWTTSAASGQGVGFRIYNAAETEYVGIELREYSGKIWAYTKSSTNLGGLSEKVGRLINGLAGSGTPRTVNLELDYANGEVRMYAGSDWDYSASGNDGVFVYAVDFATAGVTDIGAFQTYFSNWGAANVTTFDNLRIETLPVQSAQTDVHIVSLDTAYAAVSPSTNVFSYYANKGDMIVLMAASNKGTDPIETSVTFSGGAVRGDTVFSQRKTGATPYYWYAPVLSNGTVNAEIITVDSRASIAAYHLRGVIDEGVVVLDSQKNGVGAPGVTSITNSYAWDENASGLYLEAVSTYGDTLTPQDPTAVIDADDGSAQRVVAHGTFSNTNSLVSVWTNNLGNTAILGLVVDSDRIPETTDLITYRMNDDSGTEIVDLEQVGIDDNSFTGVGDGIQTDGAGNLVYSNCAAVAYRSHDFDTAITGGVVELEFKVSDWDYDGLLDGASVGFSLINTNNNDAAKISFDYKPTVSPAGTRIAYVGEGASDYNAKLGITNGTDVTMRLRVDLDNNLFDARYNIGNGWVTQSISNDLGFAEGVLNRLQLVQNQSTTWAAGAYVKVDYVKVRQIDTKLIDFQLDDEAGTLFGEAYNPGTWEGAAWNFNGPFETDGAGNLRIDLASGATRKFNEGGVPGGSLTTGTVDAQWSVSAWDLLDGSDSAGATWKLKGTGISNVNNEVTIRFDQNGVGDNVRVRCIDETNTGKQKSFAAGTLTNSTFGVDFRVVLDLDDGALEAYWKFTADADWTLIDAALSNGLTQLDEIWLVTTATTNAGYCDYDSFVVDYTVPAGGDPVVPNITDFSVSGSTVSLTWDSESGISYNVLSKSDLTDPTWTTNLGGVLGAGATTSTNLTGSGTEEFYKIEAYTP